jgi:hypothetical protein
MSIGEWLPYKDFTYEDLQKLLHGKIKGTVFVSSEKGKEYLSYLALYFEKNKIDKPYRFFCEPQFFYPIDSFKPYSGPIGNSYYHI